MASKRMFDKAIVDTDKFMDMPMSTKALYFLLGMEADDEGFVSHKKVMRVHGGSDDDLKVLVVKGFVIMFPSGVVVITDWNRNNYLDKNRMKPTEYQNEKKLLLLTQNGRYELNKCSTSIEEKRREESVSREETSLEHPSFEVWMESQNFNHDSIVDDSGVVHEFWRDEQDRMLKNSEVKTLRKKYGSEFNKTPVKNLSSFDDTERLISVIQESIKKHYGKTLMLTQREKAMIRKNLVEKIDKETLRNYARWFFVDSEIDKKWRFSVDSFTSSRFFNQFQAETT